MPPRLPVDGKKVVEHRISLGTFERQQLESFGAAYGFNRVSSPLIALLSDNSAMMWLLALVGSLVAWSQYDELSEWISNVTGGVFEEWQAAVDQGQKILDGMEEFAADPLGLERAKRDMNSFQNKVWIALNIHVARLGQGLFG